MWQSVHKGYPAFMDPQASNVLLSKTEEFQFCQWLLSAEQIVSVITIKPVPRILSLASTSWQVENLFLKKGRKIPYNQTSKCAVINPLGHTFWKGTSCIQTLKILKVCSVLLNQFSVEKSNSQKDQRTGCQETKRTPTSALPPCHRLCLWKSFLLLGFLSSSTPC